MTEVVLASGGIVKKILVEGKGDERPTPGSNVEVHYVGTLLDGTQFDSSRDRDDTFKFNIGKGQVIKGWDQGVATMRRGEKALLTCKPEFAYGKAGSPPTIPADATLQFEVELFDWVEPGRDMVTGDGGVQSLTLVEGDGSPTAKPGAKCVINIKGEDGKRVFLEQTDLTVDLADTSLVWGLEVALLKMTPKQKSRVFVKPAYGYGAKGHKKLKVPADAALVYEIEMLSITNPPSTYDMEVAQKVEEGQNLKLQGNTFFKALNWKRAAQRYEAALDLVNYVEEAKEEEDVQIKALKVSCFGNLAQCLLKESDFKGVVEKATSALELGPDNAKNLFRRAKGLAHLAQNKEAQADLKKALAKDPENKAIKAYLKAVRGRINKAKLKERNLFKGMFNKVNLVSKKEMEEAQKPDPVVMDSSSDDDDGDADFDLTAASTPAPAAEVEAEAEAPPAEVEEAKVEKVEEEAVVEPVEEVAVVEPVVQEKKETKKKGGKKKRGKAGSKSKGKKKKKTTKA